jgi:hypothetical protein
VGVLAHASKIQIRPVELLAAETAVAIARPAQSD